MIDTSLLTYLENEGGRFVKVARREKRCVEKAWQTKLYKTADVLPHISAGGNVGLLTGEQSGGLIMLDVDTHYAEFCSIFTDLAQAPTVVRGGDKGKIIIKITGPIPNPKKWKRTPEEPPYFELLSTRNQGVIPPSIHPSGEPYRIINQANPIPKMDADELDDVCRLWTGEGLAEDQPAPKEYPQPHKGERNGDGLLDQVKAFWSPIKIFDFYGRAKERKAEGEWIRLKGNGGLFVHQDGRGWNQVATPGIGGGTFEAWQYCKNGDCVVPKGRAFYELLCDMAREAHIEIPHHKTENNPPPPPEDERILDEWQAADDLEWFEAPPDGTPVDEEEKKEIPTLELWAGQGITLAEIMAPRPPIEYVVGGLLELPSLNVVYGAPGCMKSFVLADLLTCIASNTPWLPPEPGKEARTFSIKGFPVLWLDFDNGKRRTMDRFAALMRARNISDAPIHVYSMPVPWLDASNKSHVGALESLIKTLGIKVVVIDNLGTISGGKADENSTDMVGIMSHLRWVAEATECAMTVIHHQRKQQAGTTTRKGDSLRGHSSIEASLDLALLVEREPGLQQVTIAATKSRGIEVPEFGAKFSYENDLAGNLNTARYWGMAVADPNSIYTIEAEILFMLKMGPMNQSEICKELLTALETSRNRAIAAIQSLENKLKIVRRQGKNNASEYSLT